MRAHQPGFKNARLKTWREAGAGFTPELPAGYDFHTYEQWFHDFTQGFLSEQEYDAVNVRIKINHTLRVLDLSRRITQALAPPPALAELAHLAALFHDIGRFPQYSRYGTFHDQLSVNHAYLGVITLKQHRVLAALAPSARKLVLGAVAMHNRRFLPGRLPPEVKLLTQIVRDADKLDIFSVLIAHFDPATPHNHVVSLELQPHPDKFSPDILHKVFNRQLVNYQDMVWLNDFKLLLCSWIYDFNFGVSRGMVQEKGYLEKLMACLPPTPEFIRLGRQLQQDLAAAGV